MMQLMTPSSKMRQLMTPSSKMRNAKRDRRLLGTIAVRVKMTNLLSKKNRRRVSRKRDGAIELELAKIKMRMSKVKLSPTKSQCPRPKTGRCRKRSLKRN